MDRVRAGDHLRAAKAVALPVLILAFTGVAGAAWFEWHQLDHPQRGRTISLRPPGSETISTLLI
jgi:hypothetical protein